MTLGKELRGELQTLSETYLGQRGDKLTVDLNSNDLPAIAKALPIGWSHRQVI
nr:hypothetical protein [Pseudomonas grimontii]